MKYYAIKVNNITLGAHTWNQVSDLWQDAGDPIADLWEYEGEQSR